ncbi:MAG: S-layer homology domain-containing protein [Clostridia bacterium]|nr:S-layer homology domain-containing protein [Clostridia bacterium]
MKKIIATILAIVMLSSAVFATEIDTKSMEDLKNYKIITGDPDGKLRLEDNITRAEALAIVCRTLSLATSEYADEFIDVTSDHWSAPYISTALGAGIIDIDDTKKFNPDEFVTSDEIVKMFVCALGYKPFAEANGGYPMGYYSTATRYALFNNIPAMAMGKPAPREDVMIMAYSALDIPLMLQSGFDFKENTASYIIADGKNGTELRTPRTMLNQ